MIDRSMCVVGCVEGSTTESDLPGLLPFQSTYHSKPGTEPQPEQQQGASGGGGKSILQSGYFWMALLALQVCCETNQP